MTSKRTSFSQSDNGIVRYCLKSKQYVELECTEKFELDKLKSQFVSGLDNFGAIMHRLSQYTCYEEKRCANGIIVTGDKRDIATVKAIRPKFIIFE